eukprot:643851-Amphidinium_carterae.6
MKHVAPLAKLKLSEQRLARLREECSIDVKVAIATMEKGLGHRRTNNCTPGSAPTIGEQGDRERDRGQQDSDEIENEKEDNKDKMYNTENCALGCQGGVSKYDTQCAQCFVQIAYCMYTLLATDTMLHALPALHPQLGFEIRQLILPILEYIAAVSSPTILAADLKRHVPSWDVLEAAFLSGQVHNLLDQATESKPTTEGKPRNGS